MNDEQKRRDDEVRYICADIAEGNYDTDTGVVRFLWRAYERVVKERDAKLAMPQTEPAIAHPAVEWCDFIVHLHGRIELLGTELADRDAEIVRLMTTVGQTKSRLTATIRMMEGMDNA